MNTLESSDSGIEVHIRKGLQWHQLPPSGKQVVHNKPEEYEKLVLQYSIQNQLRYKGHLIQKVYKGEKSYYEELLRYSREHLMLYPYHLQDILVKGLRITPFHYYIMLLQDLMCADRSYDSLPNFTAGDCLRLCGVGRNEYIDLMNQCRLSGYSSTLASNNVASPHSHSSSGAKRFFRAVKYPFGKSGDVTTSPPNHRVPVEGLSPRHLLPRKPVADCPIQSWWMVHIGSVMESDIDQCTQEEKALIDGLIDEGAKRAGTLDFMVLRTLHLRGLIYLEVPIEDGDRVMVPTLEGFVMNRVTGDYFETLLYKIFVSLDENITVNELAEILQTDLELVKNAISVFCRLGFAVKKTHSNSSTGDVKDSSELIHHPSWNLVQNRNQVDFKLQNLVEGGDVSLINQLSVTCSSPNTKLTSPSEWNLDTSISEDAPNTTSNVKDLTSGGCLGKFAFLFDSTLAAFLMMGNLSPDLKGHAVTMFEVGKLSDEALDSFLSELDRVSDVGEGEARRYYEHAVNLRHTIRFLRSSCRSQGGMGLDLLRSESVLGLDAATRQRMLRKNYSLLLSMAPITNEDRILSCVRPPLLGPVLTEMNSPWFKFFMYEEVGDGPPSLLLAKGSKLSRLPSCFYRYSKVILATWGHDSVMVSISNALATVNDFLLFNPVLLQAFEPCDSQVSLYYASFPIAVQSKEDALQHPGIDKVVQRLQDHLALRNSCGYATFIQSSSAEPVFLDVQLGIPLFDEDLNRKVCEGLAQNNSLASANLEELVETNRSLSIRLLHFIDKWNVAPLTISDPRPRLSDDVMKASMFPSRNIPSGCSSMTSSTSTLPVPLRSFLFNNGKLKYL